jgi:glyoxylase-like metal-dependent hydrolase (beta-lactamase superfamily II)
LSFGAYPRNVANMAPLLIHRYRSEVANTPVTAYLVEGGDGVVAVDATLTVSGGRGLRAQADALGKPLLGVVLTHAHPDHYGGLVALLDGRALPVFATASVSEVIRRDDPVKEQILRPMFGAEWAPQRAFPTEVVADGETVELGDIALTVTDLGPSESPADSLWALATDPRRIFSADLAYDRTHCYLADGFASEWLANLRRLRAELPPGSTLHPGHGEPGGLELLDWQEGYIETMLRAIRTPGVDVAATMRSYLPSEKLAFLMELSVAPLAAAA